MPGTQCPRCHEPVRVPDVDGDALVQCPWCREEFRCEEVLQGLPPMLIVVGPELTGATGFQDVESYGFEEETAFSLQTEERSGASGPGRISERATRAKRKGENPVVSLLKIGGGGAAGIFIALLILQGMGRLPDMGVWPFRGPDSAFFGGSRSVKAMAPRSNDEERRERANDSRPRRSEGRSLPLPGLPEFDLGASDGTSEVSGSSGKVGPQFEEAIEGCEDVLEEYRVLMARSDEGDDDEERTKEMAALVQRFIVGMDQVTEGVVAMDEMSLGQRALLDSLVIGFSGEEGFLRETVRQLTQRLLEDERENASPSKGVWLMGKVDQRDANWVLTIPGTENRQQPLELNDDENPLEAGKVFFVVVAEPFTEDGGKLPVVFARQLQRD